MRFSHFNHAKLAFLHRIVSHFALFFHLCYKKLHFRAPFIATAKVLEASFRPLLIWLNEKLNIFAQFRVLRMGYFIANFAVGITQTTSSCTI